jgi:hypothetical protein
MASERDKSESSGGLILAVIMLALLVAFQQSYARSHESGVEQPVGYFGVAEYLFRHPERLLRL